jgi:cytochrome c oxidase assembly protein subunit 15
VNPASLVDWAPLTALLALAAALAAVPLAIVLWRHRRSAPAARAAALVALTLFLTFDLIVFGAFTRLSDSGLGCPDWPGCYGSASPIGAAEEIRAAVAAAPGGPVTFPKAWIEMIHRYLAMTVGALIVVLVAYAWREARVARREGRAPVIGTGLPLVLLAWVLVQGAFGKFTVTLKLYPAVVTLHLLGGLVLLALLVVQHVRLRGVLRAAAGRPARIVLPPALRRFAVVGLVLLSMQVALGGWVSTNYAVLACTGFPTCNGQWWPAMDFRAGFAVLRPLGEGAGGGAHPLEALVAVHMAHRGMALVVVAVLGVLAWRLRREAGRLVATPAIAAPDEGRFLRRAALALGGLLAVQVASGLSNVVLGWPLLAALGHSAGAAALVALMVALLARTGSGRLRPAPSAFATPPSVPTMPVRELRRTAP